MRKGQMKHLTKRRHWVRQRLRKGDRGTQSGQVEETGDKAQLRVKRQRE